MLMSNFIFICIFLFGKVFNISRSETCTSALSGFRIVVYASKYSYDAKQLSRKRYTSKVCLISRFYFNVGKNRTISIAFGKCRLDFSKECVANNE